jgi:predicted  nucleic acid-binding Zn-ribbon protein
VPVVKGGPHVLSAYQAELKRSGARKVQKDQLAEIPKLQAELAESKKQIVALKREVAELKNRLAEQPDLSSGSTRGRPASPARLS